MKARIQRHIEQRTALLASVSHDLRTPLTRLKLEIALAEPSPQLEAMARDLSEMEHMIDEYLAFARGEGGEEARQVMLRPLIEGVCEARRAGGRQGRVSIGDDLSAILRPQAFKRALANLIDNAAAHGETVRVSSTAAPTGGVWIFVDDDGPGIPRTATRRPSARSTAWTSPGTRTRRASAWAWPSPATWRAGWAAS
jgi:two-component system osmolarity sensor histidine kinase EnvZ